MRTVQPLVISDFTLSKRAKNQQKQTKTQEKTQVTAPTKVIGVGLTLSFDRSGFDHG
jgi:hypothetical protein